MTMKNLSVVFALILLLAVLVTAQTAATPTTAPAPASTSTALSDPTSNFAGVQVGLSPTSHVVAGVNWGHNVTGTLWAFTRIDVLGFSKSPVQAITTMTVGACDVPHALFGKRLLLGWCLDGGVAQASDGSTNHIGNALGTDGIALWRFGKTGKTAVGVMGGWVQTNLANPKPGQSGGAFTPVRVVVERNF